MKTFALVAFACLSWTPFAEADTRVVAAEALVGFSAEERTFLTPLLSSGPVALVEFCDDAHVPAVHVLSRVDAPASRIVELLSDAKRFPEFLPAVDAVDIKAEDANATAYDWRWRQGFLNFRGRSVLHVYEARGPSGPFRVSIQHLGGDLGTGRSLVRIYPLSARESLLGVSTRLDLRTGSLLVRQLATASPSLNRSMTIATAFLWALGTTHAAERFAGHTARAPIAHREVDIAALAQLMARGDLVLTDAGTTRNLHVRVAARMGTPASTLTRLMSDRPAFARALMNAHRATIRNETSGATLLDWGVDLPLLGSSGTMRLSDDGPSLLVEATGGAMRGGTWRFDVPALPWGEAVLIGTASFDPAEASWILKQLVESSPYWRAGIGAATQIMAARAIRTRAQSGNSH